MGGYPNGADASFAAITAVQKITPATLGKRPSTTDVLAYFTKINEAVARTGGYTTLTTALIYGANSKGDIRVVCANTGDSDAYLILQPPEVSAYTFRRISTRHGRGNVIDRALGTSATAPRRFGSIWFPHEPDVVEVAAQDLLPSILIGVLVVSDGCDFILEDPNHAARYGEQLWAAHHRPSGGAQAQNVVADAVNAWKQRNLYMDPVDNASAALCWFYQP